MALSRDQVQKAIAIVAADPACQKVISNPSHQEGTVATIAAILLGGAIQWRLLEKCGLAGWIRNAITGPAAIVGIISEQRYQDLICGGITAVTCTAINNRIGTIQNLKDVEGAFREPGGWAHYATLLRMMDNTEYVLDWHKTLNIQDPWVAKHADWKVAKNQIPFHGFKGFDDVPVLTDAQRAIVGAWTVNVSPWTWIYRFDDQGKVKWTDPMNGMSGEGMWTWRDYAGYVELRWQSGTTEKWKLPLNPPAEKGTCVMADGEHKVMAVKTS